MPNLLITPILFHYNYLDKLSDEAASLLSINLSNDSRRQQFKISIFLNFNRYLTYSLLFLPEAEAENLLTELNPAMQAGDEAETLNILDKKFESFSEIRSDFLNIIKTLKK